MNQFLHPVQFPIFTKQLLVCVLILASIVDVVKSFSFHKTIVNSRLKDMHFMQVAFDDSMATKSFAWFTRFPKQRTKTSEKAQRHSQFCFFATGSDNSGEGTNAEAAKTIIELELERLQQNLALIEALEERNRAQLDSFIDEEDQWNSLEDDERELLESKDSTIEHLDKLTEELLRLWMGAKSMDG